MILAYLLLLTGLTISAVAIYYSVVGLTSIFAAAAIPVIIMGTTLEVAKLVCATWIKANWERVPFLMKAYMCTAVVVLMIITSMGIFGFLSKAHLDQNLVSGDVIDKIAIYDEKIKTEKENIESNRKALKQMDATIDETIARSKTDQGAVNANAMRQRQAKERTQIQADIAKSQKTIAALNEERAPIAKEVRKVEAEVGPIKYIAALIYGSNPDATVLEKAVTWVIIMLVTVFDPLAVIMLLAAQMSFAWFRQKQEETPPADVVPAPAYEPDEGPLTDEQIEQIKETVIEPSVPYKIVDEHHEPDYPEPVVVTADSTSKIEDDESSELDKWNKMIEEAERQASEEATKQASTVEERVAKGETYIDNQGTEITLEVDLPETEESKKKTYMIKDQEGKIQVKNREL
jgi:hypothetical protein